jgi:hypothetical protein
MKNLVFVFFLISTSFYAQNYEKNWKKVIENENNGKVKTANGIVDKIYKKAFAKKEEVESIKCFFYKSKYRQVLDENAKVIILNDLKTQINQVSIPSKAILHLIYGKCLNDYYNSNRYNIQNRTNTVSLNDDFLTWANADFEKEIQTTFDKTLENEAVLKTTPLTNYEAVFDFFTLEKFKKENVFDYLLKENIAFYKSKINVWEFQPKDYLDYKKAFFDNADTFVKLNLDFIKNENLKKVLSLYQKLEIDAPTFENKFERILFCHQYVLKSSEDLLKTLTDLSKDTKETTELQKIQLEKATIYIQLASKETHPDYKVKAVAILDSIIKINNRTNAYKTAIEKKHNLELKSINIQLEKYIYPNENTRAFITYKNVDSVSVDFYKINQDQINLFQYNYSKKDSVLNYLILNHIPIAKKNYQLKKPKDYFEHTAEVILPQLKTGSYVVFFESTNNKKKSKAYAIETITVTNFSVLAGIKNTKEFYQVLDRKNGQPIEDVLLKSDKFTAKTDKDGIVIYEKVANENSNLNLILTKGNDSLHLSNNNIETLNEYKKNEIAKVKVSFYLDRAIYRPGQNVYFKGIAFQNKLDQSSIIPNCTFKVTLQDANRSIVKELNFTTNEFGSFSGEFVLPKNTLNGYFSIKAEKPNNSKNNLIFITTNDENPFWDEAELKDSSISFRVEEYKRPTFEVNITPSTETYQPNQKITVTGNAVSFAGANITNAKVKYTIRQETFQKNHTYYYGNNDGRSQIIADSITTTDAKGNFNIDFIVKPDPEFKKEDLPIFSYRIRATVTDINGETRSSTEQLITNVGYHGLIIKTIIPNIIETKNENSLKLESENLNGTFKATQGEIKIFRIRKSENKFKPRVWQKPEIDLISEAEFERLFPFEQNKKSVFDKDELVYNLKVNTGKTKEIPLDFISTYSSGNYAVVFTAEDQFGNSVESNSLFTVVQSDRKINSSELFTVEQLNSNPKKDGFIKIKIWSIISNLYINTSANYNQMLFFEENISLNNNETIVTIPIKNEFENKVTLRFTSIFDNTHFNKELNVSLKIEYPKLNFEVETFRNKMEPGKKENWSFKLQASETILESEVLASMYDKSLDKLSRGDWGTLQFQDNNNYYYYYKNKEYFGFQNSYVYVDNLNPKLNSISLANEKNELMWFGFNFNQTNDYHTLLQYQNYLSRKTQKPLNTKKIYGIVSDENEVLPGVIIKIKGTNRTTISDFDGYYQIEATQNEVVEFSFIGYETQVKTIASKKEINVILKAENSNLEEVVVVGYGIQKVKKTLSYEVIAEDTSVHSLAGISTSLERKASDEKIIRDQNLSALLEVKARKNLSETAFFFPNLKTDSKGKVNLNFTSPEALTAWKLRLLAHNKEAVTGYLEKSVITQKELMVTPNFPRFFREKDTIVITAKIANITKETKTGIALLQFFDARTMQPIDAKIGNAKNIKNFTIASFGNTTASWTITIPEGLQGVQYKILAKAGNFSDGEENILPVLTNNMLVTESIPIWVRENSKKEYTFENLKNNNSTTLKNHLFTLEYTSNPAWTAIQSLPYLMEFEHECAEQTFARFYANALASEIISSNPKIASLFETWRKSGKLNSKLEENEELKSIILAETPWLNDAQSEDEKKKNLALLFDLEKMKTSQQAAFDKLKQKQKSSGGFAWFDGSDESEYITRHILAGLGHLSKLNHDDKTIEKIDQISEKGIPFIDSKFLEYHKARTKNEKATDKLIWLNPNSDLHYLYTRSFYLKDYPLSDTLKKITKRYLETAKENWLNYSLYEKGMTALVLNRFGETSSAKKIIESLKETASNNEDWGMYWIANKSGWYWYQAPIETQSLLIEAFSEVDNDTKSVDAMKVWLLKNKQTKNWPTTKATTEAVYALLMQGTDWLSVKDNTIFQIGEQKIVSKKLSENEKEAETGYIKLNWKADEIKKNMATITITNKSKVPGYGGVYWQYFEDLDKIKNNTGTNLSITKELYLKKNTDKGSELQKITIKNALKIGDLVTVRLIVISKEDVEFIHLKDMRASCFEPVDVLSGFEYKGGLGFYKSTKDTATHFFFDQINKGTYVLEYDIRVNNTGNFSNGISTIESMYAPEYTSHTKGIRVKAME